MVHGHWCQMLLRICQVCGVSIGFTDGGVVHLAREALQKFWGWAGSQTGVSRGVNGDAEMDVVTQFLKGLRYKGEERHQVVEGEECGVEGGFIFKMGNDVEMQMERRLERKGDDEINENYHHVVIVIDTIIIIIIVAVVTNQQPQGKLVLFWDCSNCQTFLPYIEPKSNSL